MNWRYFEKPNVEYNCFEYFDNNILKGFFILKFYINIGHICQIIGDKKYFKDNIHFIENYFRSNKVDKISLWSGRENNNILKNLEFKREKIEENFILKNLIHQIKIDLI